MNEKDKLWSGIKEEFPEAVGDDQHAQNCREISVINILGSTERTSEISGLLLRIDPKDVANIAEDVIGERYDDLLNPGEDLIFERVNHSW
jgi:hypothetical protein